MWSYCYKFSLNGGLRVSKLSIEMQRFPTCDIQTKGPIQFNARNDFNRKGSSQNVWTKSFRVRKARPFLVIFTSLVLLCSLILFAYSNLDEVCEECDYFNSTRFEMILKSLKTTPPPEEPEDPNAVVAFVDWCGKDIFRYRDYLGVVSLVYSIKPVNITLLYSRSITKDEHQYNNWLEQLQGDLDYFEILKINETSCNSLAGLFEFIPDDKNAILVRPNTLMTAFPSDIRNMNASVGRFGNWSNGGFFYRRKHQNNIFPLNRSFNCVTKDDFRARPSQICIGLTTDIVPKDIWNQLTTFARTIRHMLYGNPGIIKPRTNVAELIPRIGHFLWHSDRNFTFANYVSVLSSIYVAGMEKVIFHGIKPAGPYFQRLLKEENVTHLFLSDLSYMYNTRLTKAHYKDVGKLYVLSKYGGVAQDSDVFCTKPISDELRSYEAVVGFDWTEHKDFPEMFNLGMVMGKSGSFYIQAVLSAFKASVNDTLHLKGSRLAYKTYERYPYSLHAERHLQVTCWYGKCSPSWRPNYTQPLTSNTPEFRKTFNWKDANSVHVTWPKPPKEMLNLETLKSSAGMIADIGRHILSKARKLDTKFLGINL